jgi:branched-chain amino acid transport system permease protein
VVGGLIVGVLENLVGTYLIPSELKLAVALMLITIILVVRPSGLFGATMAKRV